jgi:DNA/RNA-binding domain of Phe-tRNA-synthetase-like protein
MGLGTVIVDEAVRTLRPDFVVLAIRVSGLVNGPPAAESEAWLNRAEAAARSAGADVHPHVAAWRDAYRAFGAKPQRTPSSVEALTDRARHGSLPRVNWLVDLYNAISVLHALPVGGEDAARFVGDLRLFRATGREPFDTTRDGSGVVEQPASGEVVWADAAGVTCRRWNWRQGIRTRLTEASTEALFLLERLEPLPPADLDAAGDALVAAIRGRCPAAVVDWQRIGAPDAAGTRR